MTLDPPTEQGQLPQVNCEVIEKSLREQDLQVNTPFKLFIIRTAQDLLANKHPDFRNSINQRTSAETVSRDERHPETWIILHILCECADIATVSDNSRTYNSPDILEQALNSTLSPEEQQLIVAYETDIKETYDHETVNGLHTVVKYALLHMKKANNLGKFIAAIAHTATNPDQQRIELEELFDVYRTSSEGITMTRKVYKLCNRFLFSYLCFQAAVAAADLGFLESPRYEQLREVFGKLGVAFTVENFKVYCRLNRETTDTLSPNRPNHEDT